MTARKRRARIVRLDPGVTRGRAPVMPLGASPFPVAQRPLAPIWHLFMAEFPGFRPASAASLELATSHSNRRRPLRINVSE